MLPTTSLQRINAKATSKNLRFSFLENHRVFTRTILFVVGDSGCETKAGFLVIVLVGNPLIAKGSGDIISFELKLIFLEKRYPFYFALLTQASNFFSMTMSMFLFQFIFCRHQLFQ